MSIKNTKFTCTERERERWDKIFTKKYLIYFQCLGVKIFIENISVIANK